MSRRSLWLAAALGFVALVYANGLSGPFVRDDHQLIEEEPRVHSLRPLGEYFGVAFWRNPAGPRNAAYYRPLTTLSYAIDYQLWDGAPAGFHRTNLALHLVCCALVFGLCRRGGAGPLAAALAAALFGSLPRLTESVTWISGRSDVLAGIGALGALLLYRPEPGRHAARAAAGLVLFAGLLCKEVAAAGALAIAALEVAHGRLDGRPVRRTALHLLPIGVALAVYSTLRLGLGGAAPFPDAFGWPLRFVLACQAIGTYFLMLLDPLRPRLFIAKLGVIEPLVVTLGVVVFAGLAFLVVHVARRRSPPFVAASLALGLAALLPVLHLIPLPLAVLAADRFLFLPAAALCIGLTCAASGLPAPRARVAAALAIALLPAFGVATHVRNEVWDDELRLWEVAVEHAPPGSPEPHRELATVLSWRGQPERALESYRRAYRLAAEFARLHPAAGIDRNLRGNLALVLSELGRFDEAIPILEQLVREQPRSPRHRLNLGAVYARALRFDAAATQFRVALEQYPEFDLARRMLRQVESARALWEPLPPERPDEAIDVTAARARAFVEVGRLGDADRLWARVVDSENASSEQLRRAARYLVRHGRDRDAARRAVARLQDVHGASDEVRELDRLLASRDRVAN
jgi:tetratricopeptide (TPR) repeat protein